MDRPEKYSSLMLEHEEQWHQDDLQWYELPMKSHKNWAIHSMVMKGLMSR
jgi:hypothetical protein